ncbi:hypothetical protein INS49_003607 [Diaporthe citri]|uniref:uncharacterized protein n=1 Tax=Diaporthe citri TaxID=83186 RepID=UPI001C7F432A|nr:uncharacterized protein INS49_003607 [Diaporthe citri]KAG6355645.1 hypothetical protein INS49_003607 [Diaporthe citri]
MENPSSTQPGGPEKPAAARFSTPAQPVNGQYAQQQQPQPIELPRAEPFKTSKPFAVAKFVLGSFNLAFAIIALGLTLGVVTTSFSMDSFIGVIICLSLAVASIVWQLAEHITLAVRRGWRPIHPGAHVGVHLVLWVLAILVAPSLYLSLAYELRDYTIESDCESQRDSDGYYTGSGSSSFYCNYYSFPSQAAANKYFGMMEALAAFATLLLISHFTLFVMACVETDRRRKYGKATKVVYLVAAPGPVDGRMYYTPLATQQLVNNRGSVLPPQPVHHHLQQENADPGAHGYYAPPAGVHPGTAV